MNQGSSDNRLLITRITLALERDVVVARQQIRKVAELLGLEQQDQIRLATAVSEIARNAYQYAGGGTVTVELSMTERPAILVTVADKGAGIQHLETVLAGRYKSRTGMGHGIIGTQRLMDSFDIQTSESGTNVTFGKRMSPAAAAFVTPERVDTVRWELAKQVPDDPFYELQRQNQELMRTLDELKTRQTEMSQLNAELEATNRGVVALYAELDERATYLRRASELKTQFLSNMTHEFRTPLHSIRMLAVMLLDRVDGPLTPDQEKQVTFILKGAEELSGFVDNLLDLAKVEAGRVTLRLGSFDIYGLFDVLKGMLKPLTKESPVSLVFEEPEFNVQLFSDEGKVSQILRNFISNALKFTREGEVRVYARKDDENTVTFCVSDTGIGIEQEHLELIFEDFGQVSSAQTSTPGTGLGLPLSRRLAVLLGGKVWVESSPTEGSTFFLQLPERQELVEPANESVSLLDGGNRRKVLLIDDDEIVRYVLQTHLETQNYLVLQAANGSDGLALADSSLSAIFLDINMPGMSGSEVLKRLKSDEATALVPVIICTSLSLQDEFRLELQSLGATAVVSKGEHFAKNALDALGRALQPSI